MECLNLSKKRCSKQIDAINAELLELASIVRGTAYLTPQRVGDADRLHVRCHLLVRMLTHPKMAEDPDKSS
ncbi:hypothetical protein WKW80_27665 [Variovorax humicola]|uniref:Uncharacterized protein n=1 Tax=Variovorax humicola TaxID=1769758 RepID=A0ABU8W742_9BURK